MTTRPGREALELLRRHHAQTRCLLVDLVRRDGVTIRFTDHDKFVKDALGVQYQPANLVAMSADRREGGLRTGNQEAYGVLGETGIRIADLRANRYRGAEIRIRKVDWTDPSRVFASHRKFVRTVYWSGARWTATLESRTQQMDRPTAGDLGGTFTTTCPLQLGSPRCGVQLWPWRQFGQNTNGTSTGATWNTLTDSTASWTVNQFEGQRVFTFLAGPGTDQRRRIVSNTSNTLTVDIPWATVPSSTGYAIGLGPRVQTVIDPHNEFRFLVSDFFGGPLVTEEEAYRDGSIEWTVGANAGTVSAIQSYGAANRQIRLLIPTTFPISVNDQGIVDIGCDGLVTTCRTKFNNVLNFGGDPFAPSGQQVVEPPDDA